MPRSAPSPAWRRRLAPLILAAGLAARPGSPSRGAEPPDFPAFDISTTCRDQAAYAFAATLGQADRSKEQTACELHERAMLDLARDAWARAPAPARAECAGLAEGKYGALARCLDPALPGRAIH